MSDVENLNNRVSSDNVVNYGPFTIISTLSREYFSESEKHIPESYDYEPFVPSSKVSDFINSITSESDSAELIKEFQALDPQSKIKILKILKILIDNLRSGMMIYDLPESSQIFKAIEANDVDLVKQLIAAGVDLNAFNEYGQNALHYAAQAFNLEIMTQILKANKVNIHEVTRDKYAQTALHILARNSDLFPEKAVEGTKILINQYKADVDSLTKTHQHTPLFLATAFSNNASLVQYFLEQGANPKYADPKFKFTPLHLAMKNCNQDIIRELLNYDADLKARNVFLRQPIHEAAFKGCVTGVNDLFDQGVDLNSKIPSDMTNNNEFDRLYRGCTPLHFAAMDKRGIDVIRRLLALSVDPEIPNDYGVRAQDLATALELYESADVISSFISAKEKESSSQKLRNQPKRWHLRI